MSLILDALKRAERERRLGQAPDALDELPSPPPPPPDKPDRRRWYALAAALVVAGLALFAFWRSDSGAETTAENLVDSRADVATVPPPVTQTQVDEEIPARDPVVSARIEDDAGIASLDDLTGDSESAVDAEPDAEPATDVAVDAPQPVLTAAAPVAPGPTLYTPTKPPAPVKPSAAEQAPPAPAVMPAPSPAPAISQIVLEPAPPKPSTQPPGPIVRFGADGNSKVIPAEPSAAEASPPPSAPRPAPAVPPAPAPAIAAKPAAVPAPAPAASPADLPVLVEPAKPLYVEPTEAAVAAAAPVPAPAPPSRPAARRPSPPPAPAPTTAGLRRLRDMPAAYRADFPALSVDVHVYNADPTRRFVLINGKRYGEANALAEGPRIVEIVPDGMIMDWRNEQILYTLGR